LVLVLLAYSSRQKSSSRVCHDLLHWLLKPGHLLQLVLLLLLLLPLLRLALVLLALPW
jgi:hypothetical protein